MKPVLNTKEPRWAAFAQLSGAVVLIREAEGVGFEPTMSFPIPVFKTGAIGH